MRPPKGVVLKNWGSVAAVGVLGDGWCVETRPAMAEYVHMYIIRICGSISREEMGHWRGFLGVVLLGQGQGGNTDIWQFGL